MSVPVTINGLLSEVTIPVGETSVDLNMNIEDELLSQGLDSLDISLELPSEDALYTLNAESSDISSMISDLSVMQIAIYIEIISMKYKQVKMKFSLY